LKQVVVASLSVISAWKAFGSEFVAEDKVIGIMDEATEVFARAAKASESARRGLQLLSEIRVSMKFNATDN
jgi:hypothetical protein